MTSPNRWSRGIGKDTDYFEFWDDFTKKYPLTSNLPVTASSPYNGTALNTGTFAQTSTITGGVAVLSGAATTDNSGVQIQTDVSFASLVKARKSHWQAMLKCSDGTQDEWLGGIFTADTTLLDGTGTTANLASTFSYGVGFYKPDGESNVYGVIVRNSVLVYTTPAYAITAPTSNNHYYWVVAMDPTTSGTGDVYFYVNGTLINIGSKTVTTMPYDSEIVMAPAISFLTGDNTGTKTMTLDYHGYLQERTALV